MRAQTRALLCGLAMSASLFAPRPQMLRWQEENALLADRRAVISEIRATRTRAKEAGEQPPKGSDFASILRLNEGLTRLAMMSGNIYKGFAFFTATRETIAKLAGLDLSTSLRASQWKVRLGQLHVVNRHRKDTRRDDGGDVVWKSRSNLYVLILKDARDQDGATPVTKDDVLEIATLYRNTPDAIAELVKVVEQAELEGRPLTDADVEARLRGIGRQEDAKAAAPPSPAPAPPPAAPPAARPAGPPAAPPARSASHPDFEAFLPIFLEERHAKHSDDLWGPLPSLEAQAKIGQLARALAVRACETFPGLNETEVFVELARRTTRQYLDRPGNKTESMPDGYLTHTGHRIGDLLNDLSWCGERAFGRWKRAKQKALDAAAAPPEPAMGPRRVALPAVLPPPPLAPPEASVPPAPLDLQAELAKAYEQAKTDGASHEGALHFAQKAVKAIQARAGPNP